MSVDNKLKEEATLFFKEYKKVKAEFLRLSSLREEKLGILGYLSYLLLFAGVMLWVALRLYGIKSAATYIIIGVITVAAAVYLVVNQIRIGLYEKKSRKKRDAEFEKVRSNYNKMAEKADYYKDIKECGYDKDAYELKLQERKKEKERERLSRQEELIRSRKFDDNVCIYCKNGICNFEGDETVYSFKCSYSSCRWRTKKK